jgi:cysteine-rich repeat protein
VKEITMRPPFLVWSVLTLAIVVAVPSLGRAQDTCDVLVSLNEEVPAPGAVAYGLDYGAAGGSIVGSGSAPVCVAFSAQFNGIFDDDAGLFSNFAASLSGLVAGQPLISCVFALDTGFPCPAPSAFVVTDQAFPPADGIAFEDLFPNLTPPAVTIAVTPRTPVCGDGFREGTETCDDGNLVDGDCCSSACELSAAGGACDDGSVCTLNETCDAAGHCLPESTITCGDSDPCTTDVCDPVAGCQALAVPAPFTQCFYDHRGALNLHDPPSDAKAKLQWQMATRSSTTPAAVGNPTVDTDYAVCVYDEADNVATLAFRVDIPAGANWRAIDPTRFDYKDKTRNVNGVERLRIDGKEKGTKLQLKAGGASLPLPGPIAPDRYFAADNIVTVQLRNTVGGCWSIGFGGAAQNSGERFKAKSK